MEKYKIPAVDGSVKRKRLIALIHSLSYRSILFIHAPAGYGKTTAAVEWLKDKSMTAVWLSIDQYDRTISDFYKSLCLALLSCTVNPAHTKFIEDIISSNDFNSLPLECMLTILKRMESDKLAFNIVIDNFQSTADISMSLPLLRSHLPSGARLVLISRNPPSEALSDYILKGMVKQISQNDLQFNQQEITKLFARYGIMLSKYDSAAILQKTLGWAAILRAVIVDMNGEKIFSDICDFTGMDNMYLHNYIKYLLYEFQNSFARMVLIKTSVCEYITGDLCQKLTGKKNAWDIIAELKNKTGLVTRYDTQRYRYQKPLRDFLMAELEKDMVIDKNKLYRNAALWQKENGDIPAALDMAVKSEDISLIEQIVRCGRFNISAESYINNIYLGVIRKLPDHVIKRSYCLCLEIWFATYLSGAYEQSKRWMNEIRQYWRSGAVTHPLDVFTAFYQITADPEQSPWCAIDLLKDIPALLDNKTFFESGLPLPTFTLTLNMPFYHRALRDYCEISPELCRYTAQLSQCLPQSDSGYHRFLILLIEAGIYFERYELAKAKECALAALKFAEHCCPELGLSSIKFSNLLLLCSIYRADGNKAEAERLQAAAEKIIRSVPYLTADFNAYLTDIALNEGDLVFADNWLDNNTAGHDFALYKIFRDMTTAKALMVSGALKKADGFLEKMCEFLRLYRRSADLIEAYTLRSICLWRMKKYEAAADIMAETVSMQQKYEIPMPVVKYGRDVVAVLQKIINRAKADCSEQQPAKATASVLLVYAKEFSGYRAGFFAKANSQPIKLSPKQALILGYLSDNLTYHEMSKLQNTKITTIRDHVTKLYQKLEVNNATDALVKAREQGLL